MKWQKLSSVLQVQDRILHPIPYGHILVASMHPAYISDTTIFCSSEKKSLTLLLEHKFTKNQGYSWEAQKIINWIK